jgi:hypothetical protein
MKVYRLTDVSGNIVAIQTYNIVNSYAEGRRCIVDGSAVIVRFKRRTNIFFRHSGSGKDLARGLSLKLGKDYFGTITDTSLDDFITVLEEEIIKKNQAIANKEPMTIDDVKTYKRQKVHHEGGEHYVIKNFGCAHCRIAKITCKQPLYVSKRVVRIKTMIPLNGAVRLYPGSPSAAGRHHGDTFVCPKCKDKFPNDGKGSRMDPQRLAEINVVREEPVVKKKTGSKALFKKKINPIQETPDPFLDCASCDQRDSCSDGIIPGGEGCNPKKDDPIKIVAKKKKKDDRQLELDYYAKSEIDSMLVQLKSDIQEKLDDKLEIGDLDVEMSELCDCLGVGIDHRADRTDKYCLKDSPAKEPVNIRGDGDTHSDRKFLDKLKDMVENNCDGEYIKGYIACYFETTRV